LAALFLLPGELLRFGEPPLLCAVLADEGEGALRVAGTHPGDSYPSLTPDCFQAHLFEREIRERHGVIPQGHPWLKPVRFPRESRHPDRRIGEMDFFAVEGEEIHEVAVGPVHAGVIEPGHFRFQCHGEVVLHLEISLGYQHRGVEEALLRGPRTRRQHLVETLSGDSTAGHALAYAQAMEALSECPVPLRGQALRGVALELERLACHVGDLGALAGDVGFLPTGAFCGRLRGNLLNLIAAVCGNRFSRGLILPGGTGYDLSFGEAADILKKLERIRADVTDAVNLLWETPTVMGRFEDTGTLTRETAVALGLVGPPARACGLGRDVRSQFPSGIYSIDPIFPETALTGDVLGRARVRAGEVERSFEFVRERLSALPEGPPSAFARSEGLMSSGMVISLVEGWRGEICHLVATDPEGELGAYRIVDPSFHNWFGLAQAMRGGAISDFPLCNKSFNLSYCGFDQ
jgi:Ni,Fe-hydrogenase III large subunit